MRFLQLCIYNYERFFNNEYVFLIIIPLNSVKYNQEFAFDIFNRFQYRYKDTALNVLINKNICRLLEIKSIKNEKEKKLQLMRTLIAN